MAQRKCPSTEKIMVTSTTVFPEERSSEENVKKKRKRLRVEPGDCSGTGQRIAQELPNCNWLERKIKRESSKTEKIER